MPVLRAKGAGSWVAAPRLVRKARLVLAIDSPVGLGAVRREREERSEAACGAGSKTRVADGTAAA